MKFYQGDYSGLIEFSAAVAENPFGATLLELVENQYDDIDTAVSDIAETLSQEGFEATDEIVLGLMTGQILPEQEVVELLSELGTVIDEDNEVDEEATERNQAKLYESAVAAYDLASELLEDEDEEDEEDVEDESEEDADDEVEEVSAVVSDETSTDEKEAEFSRYAKAVEAQEERMFVTDSLSELRDYAEELKSNKCLSPHAFGMLFSRRAKDDYMNFSQAVEGNDYTAEEYLMCMNFALNLFEEMGPLPGTSYMFSSAIEQEIEDAPVNFSSNADVDTEARDLLDLLQGVERDAKEDK